MEHTHTRRAAPRHADLSMSARRRAVRAILERRYSVPSLELVRRDNPVYWVSARNRKARDFYLEAMREKQRLAQAGDAELRAHAIEAGVRLLADGPPGWRS